LKFHETQLDNGLAVIAESSPAAQSVALGFFVRTGARDETAETEGVSHFLEHMVFKGTERHGPEEVNRVFDEVGAKYNASTSEEVTLFYAAVLPEYFARTFDLLADILRPSLRDADFDVEKKVILEEIGMYDDQPTYAAYENLMRTHFAGHSLGRSVLGSNASITALSAAQMREYHRARYRAGNILLAVAGRLDWEGVVDLAQRACAGWPPGSSPRDAVEAAPPGGMSLVCRESSLQQHVMQMSPAPPAHSPLRYAADLLAVIIGDETGSRFFWELVDPGHAETAELGFNEYDGSGAFMWYFSCPPDQTSANLQRVARIFEDVNSRGVTAQELSQAKSKVASRIVLRSERPMGRLASLGHNWLYRGEYRSVADDLATLRGVTLADLKQLLDRYPLRQLTTSTVGPLESLELGVHSVHIA
jgi:predicted Zn-dependent peptidase